MGLVFAVVRAARHWRRKLVAADPAVLPHYVELMQAIDALEAYLEQLGGVLRPVTAEARRTALSALVTDWREAWGKPGHPVPLAHAQHWDLVERVEAYLDRLGAAAL